MRKNILYLLFGVLLISILLVFKSENATTKLTQGTYQTSNDLNCIYALVDNNGNFLRYNQKIGIMDQGTYHFVEDSIYLFECDNTEKYEVVLKDDTLIFVDKLSNENTVYIKSTSALVLYYIEGIIWPEWCLKE